jgi:hypothetical protein
MKKTRLVTNFDYDFDLIGLVCNIREYQLAWHINQATHLHLVKTDDIALEFNNNTRMIISCYVDESELHQHHLLKNKLVAGNSTHKLMLPELREFDYFLKLESNLDDFDIDPLISDLKNIPAISYLVKLDVNLIKNKENLLY